MLEQVHFSGLETKRILFWNYLRKFFEKVPKIDVMLTVFCRNTLKFMHYVNQNSNLKLIFRNYK